ncbi:MAG TPA: glycosyltransferase [Phycisphaerales bacterium]|nr:glycosyltransferase [Phycisphaerales bacterium]
MGFARCSQGGPLRSLRSLALPGGAKTLKTTILEEVHMDGHTDDYRTGLELAQSGRHSAALEHIRRHLAHSPDDAEALNDAGAILHCLGRSDEAIDHLRRARLLRPDSGEILWNLSETYIAAGRAREAMALFGDMQRLEILSADVLNRAAAVLLDQNDKAAAVEALLCSLKLSPEQRVIQPMVDLILNKRPRIAFFCGADGSSFLNEIVEFTRKRFQTRVFDGRTEEELRQTMQWADICWFEWCTNLAARASQMPKVSRNIVRLHRYEAYAPWPRQVDWSNVDTLIAVGNSATLEALTAAVPDIQARTSVQTVPNGVNLDKFRFTARDKGKNLAMIANLRMVKNPALALQCMQKLHYIDPEYRLFVAGTIQDAALERYLRQMVRALDLEGVVVFEGYQHDVAAWLADKHYILCTSICEGHPVAVLEAMACGLKPVVHNFLGAESVLPREFLFNISEQFCEMIVHGPYEPARYRRYVEENASLKAQLTVVNDLFTRFEMEIDAERKPSIVDTPLRMSGTTLSQQTDPAFATQW